MEMLKEKLVENIKKKYKAIIETIDAMDEQTLKSEMRYYKVNYKDNAKAKFKLALCNKYTKEITTELKKIEDINNSEDFGDEQQLVLTIEWKKSQMWGSNPRISTNYGFEGSSIGGCGYDKLSTATAQALNNFKPILKLLYLKVEEMIKSNTENKEHHDLMRKHIGYGSGYGILPYFEGGVGVSCHQKICEVLGLNMQCITSTKNTDVYIITKSK